MFGSGLNAAATTWYILQATHSETNLAWLVVIQTIPAMLMLPFSGVLIDREDRRRIVMLLDFGRGVVIACVAYLAFTHRVHIWHMYVMFMLVGFGFWMFWPTITALIQELTPEAEFVEANTLLMSGVQGGWLIAGAIVGFLYNKIGLGGILLIDVSTYVVSFTLYFMVRRGRHVVKKPELVLDGPDLRSAWTKYFHEIREGIHYLRDKPDVISMGLAWSLWLGAMLTQGVITAPLIERVLHTGAVGYGWLNGAWGVGAFLVALYATKFIKRHGSPNAFSLSLAVLSVGMVLAPLTRWMLFAIGIYFFMGAARGLAGIAVTSSMMEKVAKHFMGRVQNTFFFGGMLLQLSLSFVVGVVAHRVSLTLAFFIVAAMYCSATALIIFSPHHKNAQAEAAQQT